MPHQKNEFLSSEGDAWYLRNKEKLNMKSEFLDVNFILKYLQNFLRPKKFLEVGCASGLKTRLLAKNLNAEGYGVDPSQMAIAAAILEINSDKAFSKNLTFSVGTADKLEFQDSFFDFIYYAFCLYLVDPELQTSIIEEANRVLKKGGILAIFDFDPILPHSNPYLHKTGIFSHKIDWVQSFLGSGYKLISKESYDGETIGFSEFENERISVSMLIKII